MINKDEIHYKSFIYEIRIRSGKLQEQCLSDVVKKVYAPVKYRILPISILIVPKDNGQFPIREWVVLNGSGGVPAAGGIVLGRNRPWGWKSPIALWRD